VIVEVLVVVEGSVVVAECEAEAGEWEGMVAVVVGSLGVWVG
jgi:hypothetical protein